MKKGIGGIQMILALICVILAPKSAEAYIDPGNGAYMVQLLFTLVGAALFYIRHPIKTARMFFRWLRESVSRRRRIPLSEETPSEEQIRLELKPEDVGSAPNPPG